MNYVEHLNLFGVEAMQFPCIRGNGAPTAATAGAVGCLYMDTYSGELYKCTYVFENEGAIKYDWTSVCGGLIPIDPLDFLGHRHILPRGSRYLITANNSEAGLKKGDLVFIEDEENHYIEGNICAEEEKRDRQIHFYTTEEYQHDLAGYLIPDDVYIITEGDLRGNVYVATADDHAELKGNIGGAAKIDVWETVADITIPEGYASNVYEITEDIYADMQKITDFYIQLYVPQQTAGKLNGDLYIRLINAQTSTADLIAALTAWNHASYNLQGTIFSQCFGGIRQTSFYNLGANGVAPMPMNTLLVPRPVVFKGIQISLSDNTLTLPSGTNIKVVGRKK